MQDILNLVLHNCILDFDAEQVYLKLQVTDGKSKKLKASSQQWEVRANPKPQSWAQTLDKIGLSKILNPKPIHPKP